MLVRSSDESLKLFDSWCVDLLRPSLARLGMEPGGGEGHLDSMLRALVVGNLIGCGHEETVKAAAEKQVPNNIA